MSSASRKINDIPAEELLSTIKNHWQSVGKYNISSQNKEHMNSIIKDNRYKMITISHSTVMVNACIKEFRDLVG